LPHGHHLARTYGSRHTERMKSLLTPVALRRAGIARADAIGDFT
jgi:hypothetical protein